MCSDSYHDNYQQAASQHLIVIVICVMMLLAALILGRIEWFRTGSLNNSLPSICTFKNITGIPCPGCGLTRSWISAALGDWRSSLGYHRFGMILILYAILQIFRHAVWLIIPASRSAIERGGRLLDKTIFILAGLMIINWIFTLISL